jgi:hypothetical protein
MPRIRAPEWLDISGISLILVERGQLRRRISARAAIRTTAPSC